MKPLVLVNVIVKVPVVVSLREITDLSCVISKSPTCAVMVEEWEKVPIIAVTVTV